MVKNYISNAIQSQKVFYRYFRAKGFRRFLKENILESAGSNSVKAKSIALGVFIGITPLWGFHTLVVLFLASVLKLNKLLAFMATHISFPPLIPFIILISMMIGTYFTGDSSDYAHETLDMAFIKTHLLQYLLGSGILAICSSVFFGFLTYFILEIFKKS